MSQYQFSDELIGQIAKSLQLSMLTGTDIMDHLRQLRVETTEDGKVILTEAFKSSFEGQLKTMMTELEEWQASQEAEVQPLHKDENVNATFSLSDTPEA
tara:strand:+ start:478 stop:774 length:297 start_codon:yes stop_codon:yes gene_type:complete